MSSMQLFDNRCRDFKATNAVAMCNEFILDGGCVVYVSVEFSVGLNGNSVETILLQHHKKSLTQCCCRLPPGSPLCRLRQVSRYFGRNRFPLLRQRKNLQRCSYGDSTQPLVHEQLLDQKLQLKSEGTFMADIGAQILYRDCSGESLIADGANLLIDVIWTCRLKH